MGQSNRGLQRLHYPARGLKHELAARYEQLFDDVPINIAYLSLTRGSRFERDGRMVIWGITGKEGDQLCEILKASIRVRYSGPIRCVAAR